jgi:CRISPR-associated RAMP protein (TIGR02581 family)
MAQKADLVYSFATFRNRLTVRGTLVALTGLRIGAGRDSNVVGNDLPVLRDVLGRPLIPGASLKGALRAQAEGLIGAVVAAPAFSDKQQLEKPIEQLRKARPDAAQQQSADEVRKGIVEDLLANVVPCEAAHDFEQLESRTEAVRAFKQAYPAISDEHFSKLIWNVSSMIDLTFGSPQLAGRLFLKDALVHEQYWYEQFEVRNGVAINRDTETAESGMLYDYEVVPAGTRFDFELVLEHADEWQLGMVLLLLQPWERGEMRVGGFRSRGLGHIQLEDVTRQYAAVQSVDDVLALLDGKAAEVDETQMHQWRDAFKAKLTKPLSPAPSTQATGGSHA